MEIRLEGEGAYVYQACRELKLHPSLRVIYDDNRASLDDETDSIMLDCVVENLRYDLGSDKYGSILVTKGGGVPVNKDEDANPEREGDPIT